MEDFKDIIGQVKESYYRCCNEESFFQTFYDCLLEQSDEIAEMFKDTNWENQKHLIKHAVKSAILYAEEPDIPVVRNHMADIGHTHSKHQLNVRPGMYSLWIDSMVMAVRETDPNFSRELGESWRLVLKPAINMIISEYNR